MPPLSAAQDTEAQLRAERDRKDVSDSAGLQERQDSTPARNDNEGGVDEVSESSSRLLSPQSSTSLFKPGLIHIATPPMKQKSQRPTQGASYQTLLRFNRLFSSPMMIVSHRPTIKPFISPRHGDATEVCWDIDLW